METATFNLTKLNTERETNASWTYNPFRESFCTDPLWNSSVTWNTDKPDFTRCFQQTILTWIPCGFLWLAIPWQAHQTYRSRFRTSRWTWLSLTKMILCSALLILAFAELIYFVHRWQTTEVSRAENVNEVADTEIIAPFLKFITFSLATLFIYIDRQRARPSSGTLFLFWLLLIVKEIVGFRSRILFPEKHSHAQSIPHYAQTIALPIIMVQFALSCVAENFPARLSPYAVHPSPELLTSVPGRAIWSWFDTMAYHGWKNPLNQVDLWDLIPQDQTKTSVERLERLWLQQIYKAKKANPEFELGGKEHRPSLVKALLRTFWLPLLMTAFYRIIHDCFIFIAPQILRLLIGFVKDPTQESWKGYFYVCLMLTCSTVQTFAVNHHFFSAVRTGMHIRASIMALVYRKALRISSSAKRTSTLGEIVNLMSVDAQRLNDFMSYVNLLWSGPFLILTSCFFLWNVLGPAVLAALAILIVTMPINAFLANKSKKIQVAQMKQKDARIKLISEILNGMKVLKLYAWEESFEKQILEIRECELKQLQKAARLEAVSACNWFVSPFLVSLLSFTAYVLSSPENVLDAEKAFVAISLLNILRHPLTMLPQGITMLVQSIVSVKRLTKFLCSQETKDDSVRPLQSSESKSSILIKNATFSWGKTEPPVLSNVNLDIGEGDLVAVVGQVGTGKSSLVAAILGLMNKTAGDVAVKGSVAYVPQQAWIQNLTLRDNILFGKTYEPNRYDKVLDACALTPDLRLLAAGDLSEIGEKGTNLSGGQRQRVSLARAVYNDADVYLLDDPLSAVDAHVGKHIFEKVIGPSGLLKNKTRILVTHGISFLPRTDLIVVLDEGAVSEVGTYQQLIKNEGAFAEFLRTYLAEEVDSATQEEEAAVKEEIMQEIGRLTPANLTSPARARTTSTTSSIKSTMKVREIFRQESRLSTVSSRNGLEKSAEMSSVPEEKESVNTGGILVSAEEAASGTVRWTVYATYFKHATYKAAIGMFVSYALFNCLQVSASFWLTAWTRDNDDPVKRNDTAWRDYRLGLYAMFGGLQACFVLISYLLLAYGQIMASRNLHKGLLHRIMRAPMSFFDTTPLGRIVNRFARDMEIIDTSVPLNFESIMYCAMSLLFTLAVICISTPAFTPVIIPLGVFYLLLQRFFIASSRQLKRLEAISRSPIFSFFQESVAGSSVIAAYRQEERFILENEKRIDANTMSCFLNLLSQRWVAIRMDFAGNFVVFFAALFGVISRNENWGITPEDIGLSISYALSVTQVMNWMVRNASDMESNVVSVERIKEYSEIETEAPWIDPKNRREPDWPQHGNIKFNNYQTRYRKDLDLVLRGVECDIRPGEKIGIVGRTGAGKSSLTLALFRIVEAASGSVEIDGVDIASLGLHDVRSRITILPQEPVLFSGSLRMNLDPFERYSDEELWSALAKSHLKHHVTALPDGLAHLVAEGGENLSVGQRQLICLARALLRKTKILVLDEATAAIDLETDSLIQETIRENFAECTVLTIAHRLNTIMDSTRIMVLDAGRIRELDSPDNLLSNNQSIFYSLARSANLH
ncbi:hypothetical protein RvY_13289 [Ramazzottius varieornatus]|uniref:ABC-type glutathione-S-conjugate transporter n=1 Tax=Ramazzottius varieornatus TaxID=947166 RepID=A0A1D1VRF0_RAMVA|nr:hypothetical protein RvY_13289 [Ramazzottius varieornatus]